MEGEAAVGLVALTHTRISFTASNSSSPHHSHRLGLSKSQRYFRGESIYGVAAPMTLRLLIHTTAPVIVTRYTDAGVATPLVGMWSEGCLVVRVWYDPELRKAVRVPDSVVVIVAGDRSCTVRLRGKTKRTVKCVDEIWI
jgi:hypothetical protein